MVCPRCISAVKSILNELEIRYDYIELGLVQLSEPIDRETLRNFDSRINDIGFERIQGSEQMIITNVKRYLREYLELIESDAELPLRSDFLSRKLLANYSYVSNVFSKHEKKTIEQFWIELKCERIKELLENGDKSITEIAFLLRYSSSQYLANQFKKQTGFTPSQWKKSNLIRSGRSFH